VLGIEVLKACGAERRKWAYCIIWRIANDGAERQVYNGHVWRVYEVSWKDLWLQSDVLGCQEDIPATPSRT